MTERFTVSRGDITIGYVERTNNDEWFGCYYFGKQKSKLFENQGDADKWVHDRDDEHLDFAAHKITGTIGD